MEYVKNQTEEIWCRDFEFIRDNSMRKNIIRKHLND